MPLFECRPYMSSRMNTSQMEAPISVPSTRLQSSSIPPNCQLPPELTTSGEPEEVELMVECRVGRLVVDDLKVVQRLHQPHVADEGQVHDGDHCRVRGVGVGDDVPQVAVFTCTRLQNVIKSLPAIASMLVARDGILF